MMPCGRCRNTASCCLWCDMAEASKLKTGILGGSFDPIHWGHIALAVDIAEARALDEVWLVPAATNPHKKENGTTPAHHRLNMVKVAILGVPGLVCCDIEIARGGLSYTVDTLRMLLEQEPTRQFYLLMGDDAAVTLPAWHQPQKIVEMVPLLVGPRTLKADMSPLKKHPGLMKAVEDGWTQTPLFEISATDIRERLKKDWYCGHLVPQVVLEYIKQHHLYL